MFPIISITANNTIKAVKISLKLKFILQSIYKDKISKLTSDTIIKREIKHYFCVMIQIGKTLLSEDIIEKEFVCNLSACKGACCIDGDAGAPLLKEELQILENIYDKVEPFLTDIGKKTIKEQGLYTINDF